jgi:Holliday junction DNA helicase RuvA
MFEYIKGTITELTPTYLVLECSGVGYMVHVSVNTYAQLKVNTIEKIYLHQVVREDAHLLYGFKEPDEREMFRMLISVSGIGANTARMILSGLNTSEVASAIASGNIKLLQGIKGIGSKTAQRMVVDLKDKVAKLQFASEIVSPQHNTARVEALSALVMLGFAKAPVEKVLDQLCKEHNELSVEDLIKKALKLL